MEEIKDKLPGVEAKRTEVQANAAVAEAEAAKCLKAKQSVEEDLSVAMPALNAATKVSRDSMYKTRLIPLSTMVRQPTRPA